MGILFGGGQATQSSTLCELLKPLVFNKKVIRKMLFFKSKIL